MDRRGLDGHIEKLCELFVKLDGVEACKAFLEDLCTYKEIEQMALRAHAAKLFLEGKTYTAITEETGLSGATLSRISRALSHGSGGYAAAFGGE